MPEHKDLDTLLAWAKLYVASLTPEQHEEMLRKQAESWARGEAALSRMKKERRFK